jgi:Tfp pilus assembly protein PilF
LDQAKQLVMRSIDVNDQDQYPFYQLAQIAVEQGDGKAALSFIREGQTRSGAVKKDEWGKLEAAAALVAGTNAPG